MSKIFNHRNLKKTDEFPLVAELNLFCFDRSQKKTLFQFYKKLENCCYRLLSTNEEGLGYF